MMNSATTHSPVYRATVYRAWQFTDLSREWFEVRRALFVDALGWDLRVDDTLEIDEFDQQYAIYCVLSEGQRAIGGWRAIRTTDPYLAATAFPALGGLQGYPRRPDVWEISRLGLLPGIADRKCRNILHGLMLRFAVARNLSALIGVVDVSHARAMRACGLRLRSMTLPQPVGMTTRGKPIDAFCAELRLAEQGGLKLMRTLQCACELEIEDYDLRTIDRVSA